MKERLRLCKRIRNWASETHNESKPPWRLAHIPVTVVRNAKSYNLSAAYWSWRLLLCYAYAAGLQFTMSSSLLKNAHHKCQPREPVRSISMRGALRCGLPRYMGFVAKHPQTRNNKAENGSIFPREKIRPQTVKCSWRKLTKNALSLDA